MKKVVVNQCDFCKKTSLSESALKKHEKKCFYNPSTKSCATCLWFSRVHSLGNEKTCYLSKLLKDKENKWQILKTNCESWKNADVVANVDLFENNNTVLNRLITGDIVYFNYLEMKNEFKVKDFTFD